MPEKQYQISFSGQIANGHDLARVKKKPSVPFKSGCSGY